MRVNRHDPQTAQGERDGMAELHERSLSSRRFNFQDRAVENAFYALRPFVVMRGIAQWLNSASTNERFAPGLTGPGQSAIRWAKVAFARRMRLVR
jgi:hypothetical protein